MWEQQVSRRTAVFADPLRNEMEITNPVFGSERVLGPDSVALLHRTDRDLAAGSQRSSRSDRPYKVATAVAWGNDHPAWFFLVSGSPCSKAETL